MLKYQSNFVFTGKEVRMKRIAVLLILFLIVICASMRYNVDCQHGYINDLIAGHYPLNETLIKELYIKSCWSLTVRSGAFVNMRELEVLDINNCYGLFLEAEAFSRIRNLKSINIASNRVTNLPQRLFLNSIKLETINVSANKIEKLDESLLFSLHMIKEIDLSHNSISSLGKDTFSGISTLKILNLAHNKIQFLHPLLVFGSTNLETINLSYNKIENFNKVIFLSLYVIKEIDLSNNMMHTLENETFSEIKTLKSINLAYNIINFLPPTLFFGSTKLETVNLSSNSIEAFDETVFFSLDMIKKIDLLHNPLLCSPELINPKSYAFIGHCLVNLTEYFKKIELGEDIGDSDDGKIPFWIFMTVVVTSNIIMVIISSLFARFVCFKNIRPLCVDKSAIGLDDRHTEVVALQPGVHSTMPQLPGKASPKEGEAVSQNPNSRNSTGRYSNISRGYLEPRRATADTGRDVSKLTHCELQMMPLET